MKSNLSRIQIIQLDILKEFIRVCDKLNLRYYMVEGSMLGTVRHHGFIPWDDDIDVAMPRKDYLIFQKEANKYLGAPYCLGTYQDDNFYWMTAILFNKNVKMRLHNASKVVNTYAWIDVIPLDGAPNSHIMQKVHYCHFYFYRAMYQLSHFSSIVNVNKERPLIEKTILSVFKFVNLESKLDSIKICDRLHKILCKYSFDDTKYVMSYISDYKLKELMPKEWYGAGKYYTFEDINVRGVLEADKYLSKLYGDYMKLPSQDKQTGKHNAAIVEE